MEWQCLFTRQKLGQLTCPTPDPAMWSDCERQQCRADSKTDHVKHVMQQTGRRIWAFNSRWQTQVCPHVKRGKSDSSHEYVGYTADITDVFRARFICYITNQAAGEMKQACFYFSNRSGCGLIKIVLKCKMWKGCLSAMFIVCVKEIVNNSSFKLCPVEFEQLLNIPLFCLSSICARAGGGGGGTRPFKRDVVSGTSAYSKCQDLSEP